MMKFMVNKIKNERSSNKKERDARAKKQMQKKPRDRRQHVNVRKLMD